MSRELMSGVMLPIATPAAAAMACAYATEYASIRRFIGITAIASPITEGAPLNLRECTNSLHLTLPTIVWPEQSAVGRSSGRVHQHACRGFHEFGDRDQL